MYSTFWRKSFVLSIRWLLALMVLTIPSLCIANVGDQPVRSATVSIERVPSIVVWGFSIAFILILYYFILGVTFRNKLSSVNNPLSAAVSCISTWVFLCWVCLLIPASGIINWDFSKVKLSNFTGLGIVTLIYVIIAIALNSLKSGEE